MFKRKNTNNTNVKVGSFTSNRFRFGRIQTLVLFLVVFAAIGGGIIYKGSASPTPGPGLKPDEWVQYKDVNAERAKASLPALPDATCLTQRAESWAQYLAQQKWDPDPVSSNPFFASANYDDDLGTVVASCPGVTGNYSIATGNTDLWNNCPYSAIDSNVTYTSFTAPDDYNTPPPSDAAQTQADTNGNGGCSEDSFDEYLKSTGHYANLMSNVANHTYTYVGVGTYRDPTSNVIVTVEEFLGTSTPLSIEAGTGTTPTGSSAPTPAQPTSPGSSTPPPSTPGSPSLPAGDKGPILAQGNALAAGQYLLSTNNQYLAQMQSDGNFVVYSTVSGKVLWATCTTGRGGTHIRMQTDGNLVMYKDVANTQPIWASGTKGHGGVKVTMQDDGYLKMYNSSKQIVWDTNSGSSCIGSTLRSTPPPTSTGGSSTPNTGANFPSPSGYTLSTGQALHEGQALVSPNGYKLLMQADGNLVVYNPSGTATWATNTSGSGSNNFLLMQSDGNLCMYTASNAYVWCNYSNGSGSNDYLLMQNDGNLVVYTSSGTAVWSWETGLIKAAPAPAPAPAAPNMGANYPSPSGYVLSEGQALHVGQSLVSPTGYRLIMQSDGNLVIYNPSGVAIWDTPGSYGSGSNDYLLMQNDGNLVIYKADGSYAGWSSNTTGSGSSNFLIMQSDGNLCIYTGSSAFVWQTATEGK